MLGEPCTGVRSRPAPPDCNCGGGGGGVCELGEASVNSRSRGEEYPLLKLSSGVRGGLASAYAASAYAAS